MDGFPSLVSLFICISPVWSIIGGFQARSVVRRMYGFPSLVSLFIFLLSGQ
jgi:hypothetical protein